MKESRERERERKGRRIKGREERDRAMRGMKISDVYKLGHKSCT